MYTEKWNEYSERYDFYHCGEFIGFVDKNNTYHDENNGNAFFPHIAYDYDRYMKHYRTNDVGVKEGYKTLYGAKRALIEEYEKNTYSFKSKCTKKMNIRFLPLGDNSDFFPTPSKLAAMMFAGIKDWDCIEAILEPSAGKGDLLDALDCFFEKRYRHSKDKDIDCIEIDENLRHILEGKRRKIVYDDFLKFPHHKKYHLILMNAELVSGVEQEIEVIFDKLTATHSWYPECNGNVHYYNGWATNKAHKLGMKSIIPAYGLFSDSSWSREAFRVHEAYGVLADIEKVFNYLDGCVTAEVDLHNVLERSASMGITRNIQLKYFSVTFYKKGTVHIKFYPETERIIDAMNIYIGKRRAWLPPYYGKAEYDSYSEDEKAKINEFQGEEKYRTVYANQDMYIYEVPQTNLLMMNA